jgi:N-glycosylase/DNA lyase
MLFSLDKKDVFPVDTWIKKSAKIHFGIESGETKAIAGLLTEKFGNDSGVIQQYIYYYVRNSGKI